MQDDANHRREIEGQLSAKERDYLTNAVMGAPRPPRVALEVGTWLGGGSTLHILRALEQNREGHLWGIEAYRDFYDRMIANLKAAAPEVLHRFTPLFGFSHAVIPRWLSEQPPGFEIDFAFLDGGDAPREQVIEFRLIDRHVPVGGQIMAHDARFRKGKWLVPYLKHLDNWETQLLDFSEVGLMHARKTAPRPSAKSANMARRCLLKARLQPVELVASLLPSRVCKLALDLLPRGFATRLSQGR